MKKVLATAIVATMGFAGVASAMGVDELGAAQETLVEYGFSVDADTLSSAQVRALNSIKVDSDIERLSQAEARVLTKIRAILN